MCGPHFYSMMAALSTLFHAQLLNISLKAKSSYHVSGYLVIILAGSFAFPVSISNICR
jgi:hypothetical protein